MRVIDGTSGRLFDSSKKPALSHPRSYVLWRLPSGSYAELVCTSDRRSYEHAHKEQLRAMSIRKLRCQISKQSSCRLICKHAAIWQLYSKCWKLFSKCWQLCFFWRWLIYPVIAACGILVTSPLSDNMLCCENTFDLFNC